jgi:hypothetical protein
LALPLFPGSLLIFSRLGIAVAMDLGGQTGFQITVCPVENPVSIHPIHENQNKR